MSAADPAFEGYEGLVAALRANPPLAPDRLRQQVLADEPRRRRLPSRRLVLVVVPVAVALAVTAPLLMSSGVMTTREVAVMTAPGASSPGLPGQT